VNPFDLRGPQFLLFYGVLCALTLGALVLARRMRESHGTNLRLSDPYLIAYLRGGPTEALRLVVVSLVGRGLLEQTGPLLETVADAVQRTRHRLEQAILTRFQRVADSSVIFTDLLLMHEAGELGRTLERHGLLPDADVQRERRWRLGLALAAVLGIAAVKALVALSRGRGNVVYLILIAWLTVLAARAVTLSARTARGDAMLADLKTLFARLRSRAHELGRDAADEAVLLIAVFGLKTLPWRWAFARELFPKAAESKSGGDSSWSGSSCGSSSGSSCGSSCGGGCGGGCGGCGS
jgi:uncharacterized protein (TIGR04222 family)